MLFVLEQNARERRCVCTSIATIQPILRALYQHLEAAQEHLEDSQRENQEQMEKLTNMMLAIGTNMQKSQSQVDTILGQFQAANESNQKMFAEIKNQFNAQNADSTSVKNDISKIMRDLNA